MKLLFYKWLFRKLLQRSCNSVIPRSGEEGASVNCYSITLDRSKSPYFLAKKYEDDHISGKRWDGQEYKIDHKVKINEVDQYEIIIRHYFGLTTIIYNGLYDFLFNYLTKYVYIKVLLKRKLDFFGQYFFNKKKLISKKRIDLLKFMMNDQLRRTHSGIDSIDLMNKLYTARWLNHPSGAQIERELQLYLDSLVSSGDVEHINHEYVVTGTAIHTIERYEEEERKHREAVILQKKLVSLTIILALVGMVQAGLIKLPVLYDATALAPSQQEEKQQVTE